MKSPSNNSTTPNGSQQQLIAALYARVSTGRQEEEETIEVQLAEIKERIAKEGYILPDENIFIDDGWTGTLLPRPSLDNMRMAAAEGKFQALFVYDRGRIARKYSYQEIVIEELEERDIRFVPLHDKEIQNEEDRFFQGMQGLFHEYERFKISERFRIGKLRRAESGRLVNGQLPYGYRRIKKTDTKPAYGVIDEEQAHVVRLIYKWFLKDNAGLLEIIRRLYKQEIKSPRGKERWGKESIRRLLLQEAYTKGTVYYNKSEAVVSKKPLKKTKYKKVKKTSRRVRDRSEWIPLTVPAIIEVGDEVYEENMYEKVVERLKHNKKFAPKNKKYDYLLSGLVWCECGNRRVGDPGGNNNPYYRCTERIYKFPIAHECLSPGINAAAFDEEFWKRFTAYIKNPTSLKSAAKKAIQNYTAPDQNNSESNRLVSLKKKAQEELKRYAKAYGSGAIEFEEFKSLADETKSRIKGYEKQLEEFTAANKKTLVQPRHADRLAEIATQVLLDLDLTDRKKSVNDVVSQVIIKGHQKAEVCIKVPITEKVGLYATSRDRRTAECREKHVVFSADETSC